MALHFYVNYANLLSSAQVLQTLLRAFQPLETASPLSPFYFWISEGRRLLLIIQYYNIWSDTYRRSKG
jgi:hypothetical protein